MRARTCRFERAFEGTDRFQFLLLGGTILNHRESELMLTSVHLLSAVRPLRLIVWGVIVMFIDLNVAFPGFKFDLVNDTVGALLILAGIRRLSGMPVQGRYSARMRIARVGATLLVVSTLADHFTDRPVVIDWILLPCFLIQLVAAVLFLEAMQAFMDDSGLPHVSQSWRMTRRLFYIVYGVPGAILILAGCVALMSGRSIHYNIDPSAVCLLIPFLILLLAPPGHLYVSTSRFARAVEGLGLGRPSRGVFPVVPLDDVDVST